MSSSIPTSTSVVESSVIPAHLSKVWHLIKLQTFHQFWPALKSCEEVKSGTSNEVDVIRWTFKDGTVQDVKQEEHSSLNHYITYSIITSQPALTYTSVLSTVRCYEVTSGPHAGGTFVQWSGNFSGDADAGVIEDAKFKRREGLMGLEKAVVGASK
ncbi:MAG: hypothetical protein M1828_001289 [Chrysothrix sp. TS-e1954]|nr:MAG: hypothetical protein M1828_001289 [Chrysothrix sp. TS-e1954]